jgi:DNA polymerase-3 subunit alpha
MGIPIHPPDVNKSLLKFVPENVASAQQHGDAPSAEAPAALGIRFGLAAIKNVGEAAMASVIEERTKNGVYKSLEDFCARLDGRAVNKKILESLIRSGAMDFTGRDRAEMFARIDTVLASAVSSHRDRAQGQASMFDDFLTPSAAPEEAVSGGAAASWQPWSNTEKLAFEKELLGFYVTGHPLNPYRSVLTGGKYTSVAELGALEDRANFMAAGALIEVTKKFTRNGGKPFAVIILEDLSGTMEAMVWNDVYTKCAAFLEPGKIVAVTARVDKRGEEVRVVINDAKTLKLPKAQPVAGAGPLRLHLELGTIGSKDLEELRDILGASPGEQAVELEFSHADGRRMVIEAGPSHRVRLTPELQAALGPRFRL